MFKSMDKEIIQFYVEKLCLTGPMEYTTLSALKCGQTTMTRKDNGRQAIDILIRHLRLQLTWTNHDDKEG